MHARSPPKSTIRSLFQKLQRSFLALPVGLKPKQPASLLHIRSLNLRTTDPRRIMTTTPQNPRSLFRVMSIGAIALFTLAPLALSATAASASSAAPAAAATAVARAATGTVRTNAGGPVTFRATPFTTGASIGSISSGTAISITCQTTGTTVTGKYATSNIWDETTTGGRTGYVSDSYVYTESDGRVAPDCGGTTSAKITAVINAAKSQVGKGYHYSWGGGGKNGPSYGIKDGNTDDRDIFGFDCSGLTQYAFWKGAGIDIGSTTRVQVNKGHKVAWASRRAGDLLFWYTSAGVTKHVAIYLGGSKMVESNVPREATSVHVTAVHGTPTVVRIID